MPLYTRKDISPIDKLIIGRILSFGTAECFISQDTLAEELDVHRQRINERLKVLTEKGIIETKRGQHGKSYRVVSDVREIGHQESDEGILPSGEIQKISKTSEDFQNPDVRKSEPRCPESDLQMSAKPDTSRSVEESVEKTWITDTPPTRRKKRDAQPAVGVSPAPTEPNTENQNPPRVWTDAEINAGTSILEGYMGESPSRGTVVYVLNAGWKWGAQPKDVWHHLTTLWNKGYRPGKRKGPRTWRWFVTVTDQYFHDRFEQVVGYPIPNGQPPAVPARWDDPDDLPDYDEVPF